MSATFRRRWAELAPLRESVMVNFARPELRRWLEAKFEQLVEVALEFEQGPGYQEPFVVVGARAVVDDLWHTTQSLRALAATPYHAIVSPEESALCRDLATLADDLSGKIAALDFRIGSAPDEPTSGASVRNTN